MDKRRYEELDSLRGLAALAVMLHHYLIVFPRLYPYGHSDGWWERLLTFSPIHLLWSGHESVLLFFVLSGFVLALPYQNKSFSDYRAYAIRRIFRIYVPYAVAVVFAAAMMVLFAKGANTHLSEWFNEVWGGFSWKSLLRHLTLIGPFNDQQYDPVVWSLRVEMQISLIFPLLLIASVFFGDMGAIVGGLALFGIGWFPGWRTLRYVLMFVIGIVLARHREALVVRFRKLPEGVRVWCLPAALLLYGSRWIAFDESLPRKIANELFITAGAALIIVIALGSKRVVKILLAPPLIYMGKISYSLYLYHAVLLLAFLHAFYETAPTPLVLAGAAGTTFILSALSYRFIEEPSMALGRRLAGKSAKKA